jgi:hypothetical protein
MPNQKQLIFVFLTAIIAAGALFYMNSSVNSDSLTKE